MELHYKRPDSMEGRQEREIRTYDFLDELGIEYWQTDHDDAANTMEDCKRIDAILEAAICKNLFLCNRQKTKFYMLMMPGDKPFKTKELSSQINFRSPFLCTGGEDAGIPGYSAGFCQRYGVNE